MNRRSCRDRGGLAIVLLALAGSSLAAGVFGDARAEDPAPEQAASTKRFITDPEILGTIRDDLQKGKPDDRKFWRYFTITHLANEGQTEPRLQSYRIGLSRLLNGLSWHRRIRSPLPIDPDRTILRIDVREYAWDRGTWDAIARVYPYSTGRRDGPSGAIAEMSGCEQPVVRGDWFLSAASRSPLYDEVLRLPDAIEGLEKRLDVDLARDLSEARTSRAGFSSSGFVRGRRVIERHDTPHGVYWRTFDLPAEGERGDPIARPLGPGEGDFQFRHEGGEVLFDLPNGLQATMTVDAGGRRVGEKPREAVRDDLGLEFPLAAGASCMSCHDRGAIAKADEVRETIAATKRFPEDTASTLLGLYPPADRLAVLIARDNGRLARAIREIGELPGPDGTVPVLARAFHDELDLNHAACESGLSAGEFRTLVGGTPSLSAGLKPLLAAGGTVTRPAFEEVFPRIMQARTPDVREQRAEGGRVDTGAAVLPDRAAGPPPEPDKTGRWFVIFRGRDPKAWDTSVAGPTIARPLREAPDGTHFLRLRRMDTGDSLIIPIDRDGLARAKSFRDEPFATSRWCGTKGGQFGGLHLGIAEGLLIRGGDPAGRGKLAVQMEGFDYFAGSGFGHQAYGDGNTQHFGWRGRVIPPTDFEIAVAAGPLTADEKARLAGSTTLAGRDQPGRAGPAGGFDPGRMTLSQPATREDARDGFKDTAPDASILVGLDVRTIEAFGGTKVGAVRPIYRRGKVDVRGQWHGETTRDEVVVSAKPGYAVGGFRLRSGLLVDGFQVVFMRIQGDRLDPSDAYDSDWLGDTKGGSPGAVSGEGRVALGIHGRAGKELYSLGLILSN